MSDKMLSMPDMSADNLAAKFASIGGKWVAMFAGNDTSPVTPILKDVRAVMRRPGDEPLELVVTTFQQALRKEIMKKAEATVLGKFDITMQQFREHGLANFGPELFTRLVYEVEQISLDLTFLVFGFDNSDPAFAAGNIFTIQNRGEVSHFDASGFWAIGSGQTSALGTLFGAQGSVIYRDQTDMLYLLAKAKFNSESAPGVGKETTGLVLHQDGSRYVIAEAQLSKLKTVWSQERPPDVSLGARQATDIAMREAKAEYEARRSASQESK